MTVTVRLFARARELAGAETVRVDLPDRPAVSDLRRELANQWPAIAPLIARSAVAVDGQYAGDEDALATADEIALIPPVSGGAAGNTWSD